MRCSRTVHRGDKATVGSTSSSGAGGFDERGERSPTTLAKLVEFEPRRDIGRGWRMARM
jgi:hypothetical protein